MLVYYQDMERYQSDPKRCDSYYCRELAAYDIKKHMRVIGLTGDLRYLCAKHGEYIGPRHLDKFRMESLKGKP